MTLLRFIRPLNIRAVIAHGWGALRLLGVILVPPAFVALLVGELHLLGIFAGSGAVAYFAGRIGAPAELPDLGGREALTLTAIIYLVFSMVGGLGFLPVAPPIDAFFESVSGFTTTGLSVIEAENFPRSLLFFRSYSQWLGGAGISVLSLVVLAGPGQAAFRAYASEFGRENLLGSVVATTRAVLKIYITITAAGWLAFLTTGMGAFDALLHVFSTVSTGGFSHYPDSMGHYPGTATRLVVILFMILGATALLLFEKVRKRLSDLFRDLQLRALVAIAFLATLFAVSFAAWTRDGLLNSAFHSVSALSTTGFTLTNTTEWPEGTRLLSVILMFIGGSVGSTSGGIKLLRLIILFKLCGWIVVRASLPKEAHIPLKYRDLPISDTELKYMFGFIGLYLAIAVLSSMMLALAGYTFTDSIFESFSALGTVGLSAGVTSPDLAGWLKLVLCFDMLAGRLEILPLLMLVFPYTWRRTRRTV